MAQPPKGGLVRAMINQYHPIHGSCAIYFPGGIILQGVYVNASDSETTFRVFQAGTCSRKELYLH